MIDAQGNGLVEGGADDDVLARLELELAQLLRRAERSGAAARRRSGLHDLDRSGYLLLHTLHDDGPQHVRTLADRLGLDGSTVTRQVAALERAGHVERARDPHDGRAVVVTPTPDGRRALAARRADRRELYARVLDGWSDRDRERLATLLARLNDDLDADKRAHG
ncbi:MarR family winged helix-turn-helix transcriptional regulator [Isoptericola jiangsuensis]|uniref:MarR family winged helix-turn-helix transcriptional regulator n=1 Tax=Isoptericola jiangsuensis TaxID=548579 RepID=UPI003AAF29AB